ncbi:MAG: MBL fold metallo-hydrolase, partial [Actinomycetota bacterium]
MRATSLGHAGILIRCRQASIVCDPWFVPAFLGSWFPFPRNDQLDAATMTAVCSPDYLYVSHLHGDHFDEPFLRERMEKSTTILLPDFPSNELRQRLTRLGFRNFIATRDGEEMELRDGLRIAIHVESSITDGPGGDSAIVVSDGTSRLVNQNDCRTHDPQALTAHGPVDQHWLQYSGAIWYPMVYDEPNNVRHANARSKVESQFARAEHYVEAVNATVVVPSAGPPCFLDDDLFGYNMITGDEISIFPDQSRFSERLRANNRATVVSVPGTTIEVEHGEVRVKHPSSDVDAPFSDTLAAHTALWFDSLSFLHSSYPLPPPPPPP